MKFIKWLIKSIVIALIIIFIINMLGYIININIPVNIYTILFIAILRVPGAIVLIVFFLL